MAVSPVANIQNRMARSLVAARSAKNPFAAVFASATSALTPPSPADINQQSYNNSLATVQNKLNQWFQAAGVDTSQEIQLSVGADGTVQLANSPPNAAEIEQVLSNHPELGGMLQSLSNSYQTANPPSSSSPPSLTPQFVLTLSGGTASAAMS